jgi:hypothetical protein
MSPPRLLALDPVNAGLKVPWGASSPHHRRLSCKPGRRRHEEGFVAHYRHSP